MASASYCRIFLRFKSSSPKSKIKNNPFNFYLRKNRKWPLSPYNAKYQEKLNQQEALRALKQSASLLSPTHLLSSLIDSFTMYNCSTTPHAYHFVIKTLIKSSQWQQLNLVLDRLEKVEIFETPEVIFIDLIESYGNLNQIQESIDLFFKIPNFRCNPSVDSLNSLLLIVCNNKGWLEMVPDIVLKSRSMNIRIDESSYCILIKALCRINKVNHAFGLWVYMIDDGFELDERMCSLILSTLCRQGDLSVDAFTGYLEEMKAYGFCLGRLDWCNVIRFLVRNGKGMDALNVLNQMKVDGIKPDVVCYTMVIDGVIEEGDYAKADELFDDMLVLGVVPDIWTYNVYLCGLFKQKNMDAGMDMLACIENVGCKPDVVTYNGILSTLCASGELNAAKVVANLMRSKGVQHNLKTYEIMLGGMIGQGEIREACNLLEEMVGRAEPQSVSSSDQLPLEVSVLKRNFARSAMLFLEEAVLSCSCTRVLFLFSLIKNSCPDMELNDSEDAFPAAGASLVPLWDREKERDKREMAIIYINLWSRHPYSPQKDCENLQEPIRLLLYNNIWSR